MGTRPVPPLAVGSLALALILSTCSGKEVAGRACPDGATAQVKDFAGGGRLEWCELDGARHGPLRQIGDYGQTMFEGSCDRGTVDGTWTDYVSDQTTLEIPFEGGVAHGSIVERKSRSVVTRCDRGEKIEGPYGCTYDRFADVCAESH